MNHLFKEKPGKTNRPQASKFKQQKLDAWQPILTPSWVIGTFLVMGIIFCPIGAVLLSEALGVYENSTVYDGESDDIPVCTTTYMNEGYQRIQQTNGAVDPCIVSFTFDRDIPPSETLYIYYQLTNFFQNHRRYVQSVSEAQLQNQVSIPPGGPAPDSLSQDCDPPASLYNETLGLFYYPCGLIATSYFNDGIQLAYYKSDDYFANWTNGIFTGEGEPPIDLIRDGIAWDTDLSQRFRNPIYANGTGNALQYGTYAYLWQTYDQMSCYNSSMPTQRLECLTWRDVAREQLGPQFDTVVGNRTVAGSGCAACRGDMPDAVAVFEGGIPPPSNYIDPESDFGIRSESFIVWMRVAALPTFRKLYGVIEPALDFDGFKKGDEIGFRIVPNFLVQPFGGTKALVITTAPRLGGKNGVLGVAYLVVGILCLVLAFLFFLKMKLNPRKLGDPKYLHWKQN